MKDLNLAEANTPNKIAAIEMWWYWYEQRPVGLDADSHPCGHLIYGKVTLESVTIMPWGLGLTSA